MQNHYSFSLLRSEPVPQPFFDFYGLDSFEEVRPVILLMSFCLGCLVFPHDSIQVMPLWWDYHRSDAGFSLHRVRQSTVLTCPVTADTHLIKVVSASLLHCRSNSFLFSLFLYLTTFSNSEKPGSFFLNIFIPSIPRYIANFPPPLSYSTFSTIYV